MPFEIVRNDLTRMQVDAIVNAANHRPVVGYGVDSAVHTAAGPELLSARHKIGDIAFGDAAMTAAYGLQAVRHVIHAVSPLWQGGDAGEVELLRRCYTKALDLAREAACESVAFPLLACGNQGFPRDVALQTAVSAISAYLMQHELQVYLVVYEQEAFTLSEKLFCSVKSYIDDSYIAPQPQRSVDRREWERQMNRALASAEKALLSQVEDLTPMAFDAPKASLEELLAQEAETFSRHLFRLIDERGMKDPEVYKRANIDRKLFSKIRSNPHYQPSKPTALALAIALRLDYEQTLNLIHRAGFTLGHASKFDIIVEYFLLQENYDIYELNEVLFAFEQPTLGG